MASGDDELRALGFTPEEIQYVNTMSSAGGISAGAGGLAMQQRNNAIARNNIIKEVMARKGTAAGGGGTASGSTQASESLSSSFAGIADQGTRDIITQLINQFNTGGTEEFKKAQAEKAKTIAGIDTTLADYTKKGAFEDAVALIQSSLKQSMEAQKPVIQKAIEGSGTSASSMQALLSQQLADKASLSAGALGAEQAKAYGQIASSLLNTRGGLTTGVDQTIAPLTALADLLKVSSSQSMSKSSGSSYGNFNPNTGAGNPYGDWGTFKTTAQLMGWDGKPVKDTVTGTGVW